MKIQLDIESLTLREVEDFEEACGLRIGAIEDWRALPAKALRALVWIAGRRDDPAFTFEGAGDVRVVDLSGLVPTDASENGGSSSGSHSSRGSTDSPRLISGD